MIKEITKEELDAGYIKKFGKDAEAYYSAPGRTELSGNHTDHQHGKVLAAAIDIDIRAAVGLNGTKDIVVESEGHDTIKVSLDDLGVKKNDGGSTALVRGIAYKFKECGHDIDGFNAYIRSNVLKGSGLSSSAAFEVLIATIINDLCGASLSPVDIAKISQFSENVYFKKPCGLMDQMASAMGNCVYIDFRDTDKPVVERVSYDFKKSGYTLCIIDSGAAHDFLTHEYAAITDELKDVCSVFGKNWLSEVDEKVFLERIKEVNDKCGDRAVLRALHVFEENRRVIAQVNALKNNDFTTYLMLMKESGRSSWMYLQNVIPSKNPDKQDLAYALAVCEKLLGEKGVCRVHGGGFAGTLQAFVKNDYVDEYKGKVDAILGEGACCIMDISPYGGRKISFS